MNSKTSADEVSRASDCSHSSGDVLLELIAAFNRFFEGTASAEIVDNCVHITVGTQTLIVSLPTVVGGQCRPVDVTD
jgi:hypothetical protein